MIKNDLLARQRAFYEAVTQAYSLPLSSDENSTVSIILSVIKTWESDARNIMLAFKGIIMPALPDKAPNHEDITDTYGWIASLHWIKSPKLVRQLSCAKSYNFRLHDDVNNQMNCRFIAITNPEISLAETAAPLECQGGGSTEGFVFGTGVGELVHVHCISSSELL